ncbi:HCMVUL111, partial [Human betaherpesvirus 5]
SSGRHCGFVFFIVVVAGFASSEAPRKKTIRTREEETITDSIAAACRPSPPPNCASQVGGPLCYDVFVNFFFQFLSSAVRIVSVGTNYQSDGLSSPLDGKTKFFFSLP